MRSIGMNISDPSQISSVLNVLNEQGAGHVELLIDNFLHCDPASILAGLGNRPVAFHIMNSRFLERDPTELARVAKIINNFAYELKPLYISDHLLNFTLFGLPTPITHELDYHKSSSHIIERIDAWQTLLNTTVHFENVASSTALGLYQPEFYHLLTTRTACGILFDISNALVAKKNIGVDIAAWYGIIKNTHHFHVGGYSQSQDSDTYWIDSHDCMLDSETFALLNTLKTLNLLQQGNTLTLEYDHAIDYSLWRKTLIKTREILQ